MCEVISNSDIKPPAHHRQPLSSHHHHHCATIHCHHRAPLPMPICGPTQGSLVNLSNPKHHPPHHLSAATPILPASSTTMKTTTTTQEGWKSVRRMGRRGTGGQKDDDDVVCNPHTMSSIPFLFYFPSFCLMTWCATHTPCCQFLFYFILLPFVWRCGVQPTCRVVNFFFILFSFLLFDDTVCNPHAMSSISFFILFSFLLFDDAVCNPHTMLSIPFYFYFLPFVWWCGMQPTCHVIVFFFFLSFGLMHQENAFWSWLNLGKQNNAKALTLYPGHVNMLWESLWVFGPLWHVLNSKYYLLFFCTMYSIKFIFKYI